jgi:hypothetical protein
MRRGVEGLDVFQQAPHRGQLAGQQDASPSRSSTGPASVTADDEGGNVPAVKLLSLASPAS